MFQKCPNVVELITSNKAINAKMDNKKNKLRIQKFFKKPRTK